jgi:hypothetical protein
LISLAVSVFGEGEGFSIRWIPDPADARKAAVEVSGIPPEMLDQLRRTDSNGPEWRSLLSIRVSQRAVLEEIGLPAMLGKYFVIGGTLRFEPQFPLDPGTKYNATFVPARLPGNDQGKAVSSSYQTPTVSSGNTTTVSEIYPTSDVLPENLLKFYIHFSGPMEGGQIYNHIQLLDEKGEPVELPFLEIDEELWNKEMTRLTLFLDPGRIKRGVRPLEEVGPSLVAGRSYTLIVRSTWKDAVGNPLKEAFAKKFRVTPPDRTPIRPELWKIQAPPASTRQPLRIHFDKALDHALALRMIRIMDWAGSTIEGGSATKSAENELHFTPSTPWKRGSYSISVESTIEDLAGNNIGKAFEVDLFDTVQNRIPKPTIRLSFEVR